MSETDGRSKPAESSTRLFENASALPEAIQWHEGMLLEPQHFQQLAALFERRLQYQAAAIAPFHWGVRRLDDDSDSLRSGIVRITDLEAVLPDGLVVSLRDGADLSLDLGPHKSELEGKTLPVYLAVVRRSPGLAPVGGERARYESVAGEGVADENTGDSEVLIPRLRPRLQLIVSETLPTEYIGVPLLKVRYRDDQFIKVANYQAPSFRVERASPIGQICNSIIQRVWEKADALIKMKVPSATRAAQSLETKLMVQSLVSAAPRFQALLRTEVSHPFDLYLELSSIAGTLAFLGDKQPLPPSLPPYDHNDLHATFEGSRQAILRVLEKSIVESFNDYPFQLLKSQQGWVFYIEFAEEWTKLPLVLGVRGGSNMTDKDVAKWMSECVIASRSKIQNLGRMRTRGAERSPVEGDSEFIPARGVSLFSLTCEPEHIQPNETLVVTHPNGGERPQEIVLYVKHTPAARAEPVSV